MLINFFKKYPESLFLVKFFALFLVLYYSTEFWTGITAKGGLYSAFCDEHLNFVKWLRIAILKGASVICYFSGYTTTIINTTSLKIIGGSSVNMVYSCIGFGVLSCWAAFAIVYPACLKRKLLWLFGGLLIICLANMIRVAVLLMLVNKTKNANIFPYHHGAFNIVVYSIVLVMIYFYTKENKLKSL